MVTVLEPIQVQLDGRVTRSETTLRETAPHVVLTTTLPDVPLTVVTVYIGADDVATTAVHLVLARRPQARTSTRTLPRDEVPVTHARDRCLLDHLAETRSALSSLGAEAPTIEVDDAAVRAVSDD